MEDGSAGQPILIDDDTQEIQERLIALQQMYQQKQGSTATATQPNITIQQLQQYYLALQQQQLSEAMDTGSTSSLTGVGGASSSSMGGSMPQTPTTSVSSASASMVSSTTNHATPPTHRSRKLTNEMRSLSGSSQTISQHTKDRLKMMIISKRGGGSTDSGDGGPPSAGLVPGCGGGSGSSATSMGTGNGDGSKERGGGPISNSGHGRRMGSSKTPPGHTNSPHMTAPSPHFEPYPVSSHSHQRDMAVIASAGEFALRKVNSEPNMKMKIRARILSKGNSPVHSANSAFNFHPSHLQRQESDSSSSSGIPPIPPIIFPPSMMMPSPSLPNLLNPIGGGGLLQNTDLSTLLAQAAGAGTNLSSFLSLPSLFKQQMGLGQAVDEQQLLDANRMQLDPRIAALGTANLPGYPSLLKQQLRELVLRRKSLVREEPEDDGLAALAAAASRGSNSSSMSNTLAAPGGGLGGGGGGYNGGGGGQIDVAALAAQLLQPGGLFYNGGPSSSSSSSLLPNTPPSSSLSNPSSSSTIAAAAAASLNDYSSALGMPSSSSSSSLTGLAYDDMMGKHECICGQIDNHVEHGGRVTHVWRRLAQAGLVQSCERIESRQATVDEIKLVHDQPYADFFSTPSSGKERKALPIKSFVQLGCGGIGVDSDTYYNDEYTAIASRLAVGNLINLCSAVVEGKVRNGFACIRPPGHHAEKELAMGFCYFNNVAIAVRALQRRYPTECAKIAIIDWDVHHGNGTQPVFEEDPSVLYLSIHRHDNGNFFPGTGAVTDVGRAAGKGFSVNVAFSGSTMGDPEYLAAWRVLVTPILDQFQPDFIIVSAGFDACTGHAHALGGYEVSSSMYGYMTRSLMGYANGKIVLAMEGGYNIDTISDAAVECVKGLQSRDEDAASVLSEDALSSVPCVAAQETIQKVIAIHKGYWPILAGGLQPINISEAQWQMIHRQFKNMTVGEALKSS